MTTAMQQLQQRLERLDAVGAAPLLAGIRRGVEREALRITPDLQLSQRPHPTALGSALTHASITTDFSEAQPELVTGVHTSIGEMMDELAQIHAFVWRHLDGEMLWPASMPCPLPAADDIPLAQYGNSNLGRFKHLYRLGLKHRYGSSMQTICGLHYNFSLPDEFWPLWGEALAQSGDWQGLRNEAMLALARNFNRCHWVVLYLTGASPALCTHPDLGQNAELQPLVGGDLHAPRATSLRSSGLGYTSGAQNELMLDYNNLENHCRILRQAIDRPYAPWGDIKDDADCWLQLGNGLLQIENELYAPMRLKCIEPGMRPLTALETHGIRHLEVRCVDLNPQMPMGLDEAGCRMLELLLLKCLLLPSPPAAASDHRHLLANTAHVSWGGRNPDTQVLSKTGEEPLHSAIARETELMQQVAQWLAASLADGEQWLAAAELARQLAADPEAGPAGQQVRQLTEEGWSFRQYAAWWAEQHRQYWQQYNLPSQRLKQLNRMAQDSHRQQQRLEQQQTRSFEDYLMEFFQQ